MAQKIPTSFMNGPLHIFHGRWRYRMSNKIYNSRFSYKITAKLLNFKKQEQVTRKDYVYLNVSIKIHCPLRYQNFLGTFSLVPTAHFGVIQKLR